MKRSLLFTFLLLAVGPASMAKAESIGVWRWLGLGWGPGYHSGEARHHGHHHHQFPGQPMGPVYGQPVGPAWEESAPVAPQPIPAAPPELEAIPSAGALPSSMSPAQQAAIRQEMQRRAAESASKASSPGFQSLFDPSR